MANFHAAIDLTGGASGALDAIDGAILSDQDGAFVLTPTEVYFYDLDDDSAEAENSPLVISPDSNAGDKRWKLLSPVVNNIKVLGDITDGSFSLSVPELQDAYDHISSDGADHSYIDQDVTTTSTPEFAGINLTNLTNPYIPMMGASGLQNSSFQIHGTSLRMGGWIESLDGYNFFYSDSGISYLQLTSSSAHLLFRTYVGGIIGSIAYNGRFKIGPGQGTADTIFDIENASPFITTHCSTASDADAARASRWLARGHQSGNEESILGYDEWCHDGTGDDELGMRRWYLNDGNDGTSPSVLVLSLRNTGILIGRTIHFASEVDNGNSGSADTINWAVGNRQKSTLTADCTYTFDPAPNGPCRLTLRITQDGTAGWDATWPGTVTWLGTEPTWTAGGAGKSIIVDIDYDGSTYWARASSWEV